MTDNNIWGLLSKKKKENTLSIPTKPTKTDTTASTPNTAPTATPKTNVNPVKVKKVKPQQVQQQAQPIKSIQQTTQYNLADFKLAISRDSVGIHLHILYQNQPIHQFLLPRTDYVAWYRFQPQQKYDYVRMRVNPTIFGNDQNLIHQVVLTICNILNTLFDNSVKMQAQAQAQQQQQRDI